MREQKQLFGTSILYSPGLLPIVPRSCAVHDGTLPICASRYLKGLNMTQIVFTGTQTASGQYTTNNNDSLNFNQSSSAGSASITNNSLGYTEFTDTSRGGSSTINNNGGTTSFLGSSTAEFATISNSNYGNTTFSTSASAGSSTLTSKNNGYTQFAATSSAGTATISSSSAGYTLFTQSASAGSAQITSDNSDDSGSKTYFEDTSTAGSAAINALGFHAVEFSGQSTAGSATLTIGTNGSVAFGGQSNAGQARLVAGSGAFVDFADTTGLNGDNRITAGSIEGTGSFYLGANQLTVGTNNRSTTVSGQINDGRGQGGALVHAGVGTLTLAGANLYSGGTTLVSGTLDLAATTSLSQGAVVSGAAGTGPIRFSSGAQTLQVEQAALTVADATHASLAYLLSGFGTGDVLDLRGIGTATGASFNAATRDLTVTGGSTTVTAHLDGAFSLPSGQRFRVVRDGVGGSLVGITAAQSTVAWSASPSAASVVPATLFSKVVSGNASATPSDTAVLTTSDGLQVILRGTGLSAFSITPGLNPYIFSGSVSSVEVKSQSGASLLSITGLLLPLDTFLTNNTSQDQFGNARYSLGYRSDALSSTLKEDNNYVVTDSGDLVSEASGGGYDRVLAQTNYTLQAGQEIEALFADATGSTAPINLTGNEFANLIVGSAGANQINGGAGADTLYGYGGDDTYTVDNAGDRVVEALGGGYDRVLARSDYALQSGQEVEALYADSTGSTAAINLSGNEFANVILGSAGANKLDGGAGADTMYGYGGDDTYTVDNSGDRVFEATGGGYDRVLAKSSYELASGQEIEALYADATSSTAAINLIGNEVGNVIIGSAGANLLDGRGGSDVLQGLGGADSFRFSISPGGSAGVDRIVDFSHTEGDRILLSGSDFGLTKGALSANLFKDAAAQSVDVDDRVLYNHDTGGLYIDRDGRGGADPVLFATLDNKAILTASDFTVV